MSACVDVARPLMNAVKWHLRNAYRKLDLETREELRAGLDADTAATQAAPEPPSRPR